MLYLVLTLRTPQFQESVITPHYAFLDDLRAKGLLHLAGPFTDKTGGAYVLHAENIDEAKKMAESDPVCQTKSSQIHVYEWNAS